MTAGGRRRRRKGARAELQAHAELQAWGAESARVISARACRKRSARAGLASARGVSKRAGGVSKRAGGVSKRAGGVSKRAGGVRRTLAQPWTDFSSEGRPTGAIEISRQPVSRLVATPSRREKRCRAKRCRESFEHTSGYGAHPKFHVTPRPSSGSGYLHVTAP